jgi:predicted amidohydrolase
MRVGIWQTAGEVGQPAANVAQLAALLDRTAERPDIIVCPELWTTGYNAADAIRTWAEPADGASFAAVSSLARRTGVAIAYGYPERETGSPLIYNSAQLVGTDGAPVLRYRKLQLWGEEERDLFTPGQERCAPADYLGWKVGFSICYDTEFPETFRSLAQAGAELILAPTALAAGAPQVPDLIIPVRALENHLFIAFANRCGREDGMTYHGGSCLVGPDGAKRVAASTEERLLVADIDKDAIAASIRRNPYLRDLRTDL